MVIGVVLLTLLDFHKLNIMFSCLPYNKDWHLEPSTRVNIIKYKSYKYYDLMIYNLDL